MPPIKIQTYLNRKTADKIRYRAESKRKSVYRYVRDVLEAHVRNTSKENRYQPPYHTDLVHTDVVTSTEKPRHPNPAIHVGDVKIELGWKDEPAFIGELNSIVLRFTKQSKPIFIDPRYLSVEVRCDGMIKRMDIKPIEELGLYSYPMVPTKLGAYLVRVSGKVDGNNVNAEIPIEDTEERPTIAFSDAKRMIETVLEDRMLSGHLSWP